MKRSLAEAPKHPYPNKVRDFSFGCVLFLITMGGMYCAITIDNFGLVALVIAILALSSSGRD